MTRLERNRIIFTHSFIRSLVRLFTHRFIHPFAQPHIGCLMQALTSLVASLRLLNPVVGQAKAPVVRLLHFATLVLTRAKVMYVNRPDEQSVPREDAANFIEDVRVEGVDVSHWW
eukprot:GHVU01176110.1.p1 GENE.GHVU01176110.1~~GHVU01176110.1.p1  ORF type:complete len:115 (-),score=7.48 GHVU01176110.1:41-385(-)